jgi:bifunctional DNase/RNase
MVLMKVEGVGMDPGGKFLVVLNDDREHRRIHIVIGLSEATSIALALKGEEPERPLSHDLLGTMLSALGQRITGVAVTRLEAGTYFALLCLEEHGEERQIDARPSDAIALAVRAGAPVFVAEEVLEEAQSVRDAETADHAPEERQRFRELISRIAPGDSEA